MTALFTVAQIRAIEVAAAHRLAPRALMLRAAQAISSRALQLSEGPFLVIAGPGNNGGDALEAALNLHMNFRDTSVVFLGTADRLPADARAAFQRCVDAGVHMLPAMPAPITQPVVVDGLFGIGLARPIAGDQAQAVDAINASGAYVVSIDIPSGIDADTGAIVGASAGRAVRAHETVTFIGDKPGLHTGAGVDHVGALHVDALDIDPAILDAERAKGDLNQPDAFAGALITRARNSHKGTFGSVAVCGGNRGMNGAGFLAARAALYAGAGRVYLHPLGEQLVLDPIHPEIMIRDPARIDPAHVVLAGPGLGDDANARTILSHLIGQAGRLVLDADALNLVAADSALAESVVSRAGHAMTLMTPHPLEAARLLGVSNEVVGADRIAAALQLARRFNARIVLKGAGSVIAAPDGRWSINPTGNPGLASAGTGDVLAGVLVGLLAQFEDDASILRAAVWLHGAAADALVARGIGPVGLTASELMPEVRALLNRLIADRAGRAGHDVMRPAAI